MTRFRGRYDAEAVFGKSFCRVGPRRRVCYQWARHGGPLPGTGDVRVGRRQGARAGQCVILRGRHLEDDNTAVIGVRVSA